MLTQNPCPATTWIHIPGSKTWGYIAIAATLSATAAPAIADDSSAAIAAPEAAASVASAPSQPAVTPPASHWGAAMDDFLLTALAEDPSIERARASITAAEDGITAAKWQFDPSPSISRELAGGTHRYVNVVRVQQPLFSGGLLTANLSAARTALRGSQQELLAAQLQLKLRIVQTWADWAKARGRVQALETLQDSHRQLLDMIRRRHQAGVATNADAALAASRESAVQAELAQARLEEGLQRDRLARLARRPVEPSLGAALDGAQPAPPELHQVLNRIQLSPEIALARANVDLARDELAKAKAALLPTISLRLEHQSGVYRDQRVGLVFQAGLQGGLSGLAGVNAARARIAAAEAAVDATEQDLLGNYQLEYTRFAAAGASLRNAELTAATGEEVLASYRRQFDAGKRAWLDLLNMVREAHATRQTQRDAAIDERAGRYRLGLLLGDAAAGD